jgi:hypothetical protein
MNESLSFILYSIVIGAFLIITWVMSASNIGTDCNKLGKFYIGNTVYKCEVIK